MSLRDDEASANGDEKNGRLTWKSIGFVVALIGSPLTMAGIAYVLAAHDARTRFEYRLSEFETDIQQIQLNLANLHAGLSAAGLEIRLKIEQMKGEVNRLEDRINAQTEQMRQQRFER